MKHFSIVSALLRETGEQILQARSEKIYSDRKKLLKIIKEAINTELTRKQKRVVMMHYGKQYSVTRIAYELGVNKSAVSRILKRSLQRLTYAIYYLYYKS